MLQPSNRNDTNDDKVPEYDDILFIVISLRRKEWWLLVSINFALLRNYTTSLDIRTIDNVFNID